MGGCGKLVTLDLWHFCCPLIGWSWVWSDMTSMLQSQPKKLSILRSQYFSFLFPSILLFLSFFGGNRNQCWIVVKHLLQKHSWNCHYRIMHLSLLSLLLAVTAKRTAVSRKSMTKIDVLLQINTQSYGCFLKWWYSTPNLHTPKWSFFSRKTGKTHGLLGRFPHHFRVHPHIQAIKPFSSASSFWNTSIHRVLPRWFPPRFGKSNRREIWERFMAFMARRGIREKGTLKKLLNHWSIEKKYLRIH